MERLTQTTLFYYFELTWIVEYYGVMSDKWSFELIFILILKTNSFLIELYHKISLVAIIQSLK